MPLPKFTFFFDDGLTQTTCNPTNDDLVFSDTPDDDFGFMRRVFETQLIFRGADFDFLFALEQDPACNELRFVIEYDGVESFDGIIRFKTQKMRWDLSNCIVRVSLDSNDNYTCLTRNWEKEINILDGTDKVVVKPFIGELQETFCTDVRLSTAPSYDDFSVLTFCITGQPGWTLVDHYVIQNPTDEFGNNSRFYSSRYVRERATIPCVGGVPVAPPGDGWVLITNNCPTNSTWVRAVGVDDVQEDFTNPLEFPQPDYLVLLRFRSNIPTERLFGIEVDNGVSLKTILDEFNPCPQKIVSNFLNIEPDGSAPVNKYYETSNNNLHNIVVFRKSDVKRFDAEENATNGRWEFKAILDALRLMLNIEIRITNTEFRIEHKSYFEAAEGLDLTVLYPNRIAGLNQYEYNNTRVAASERWAFQEPARREAEGVPIEYECFSDDDELRQEYLVGRVQNDFAGMVSQPDNYSDDGFCFVATAVINNEYYIISETNALTGKITLNSHLHIPNLQERYLDYDRPLLNGTMNNQPRVMEKAIRRKQQVEISVPMKPNDYFSSNAEELIKTRLGWGKPQLRYSAKSRTIKIVLEHD